MGIGVLEGICGGVLGYRGGVNSIREIGAYSCCKHAGIGVWNTFRKGIVLGLRYIVTSFEGSLFHWGVNSYQNTPVVSASELLPH